LCKSRWGLAAAALVAWLALAPTALANGRVTELGAAPSRQQLSVVLPLKADISGLEQFANAVTTVGSPLYGDYQPIATLERRFGTPAGERSKVVHYLRRIGASHVRIDATGLFADATMRVSLAQRTFGTSLARYQGARATRYVAPARAARIPGALAGAVTGVVGLNTSPAFGGAQAVASNRGRFPHRPAFGAGSLHAAAGFGTDNFPSGYQERTGTASGCPAAVADRGFTPNQYLTAFDYAPLQAAGVTGQGERVALIEIDGFRYSDLRAFAGCFSLPVPAINGYGVGLKHPLAPGGETTLDLEVLDAAAPGLKEIDVYESQPRASQVLEALTAPLQNRGRVPDVISASLGTCEPALAISIGQSGVRAAEGALALAAASGISVLAASGDDGSSACVGHGGPLDALAVSYPASSPYVTGVGGTNVSLTAANTIQAQTVWNDAPSDVTAGGGGLSGLFKRPTYQNGFVAAGRRAVPDVSMLADVLPGYDIYCTAPQCTSVGGGNPWIAVGGTSAASPLLAGGLALVDELLREHGRQDIGLANPLLYQADRAYASSGAINDITTNDNDLGPYLPDGNRKPLGCCTAGPGYDYASGLGTVDLAKLALIATAVQPPVAGVGLSLPRQRPVSLHHLLARLSCSRRCDVAAAGTVTIAGRTSFGVGSRVYVFGHRRSKTVPLALSSARLRQLQAALAAHRTVYASVTATVVDAGGNVEARSRTKTLRITG
jgi:subtilase family serine protease